MNLVLCPGMHGEALTAAFERSLQFPARPTIFPAHVQPSYSPHHVLAWLRATELCRQNLCQQNLCIIAFSAGVVGALGAARTLHREGITIRALIAVDGWGVPLEEPFPIHRLSHDRFTHQTSLLLGPSGGDHFYADPPVPHLTLWRSPQQITGWRVYQGVLARQSAATRTTAAAFLEQQLQRYAGPVREPVQP